MGLITNHQKSVSEKHFSSDQIVQILSLDGGGLKGLFSASVIETLEEQIGHSISKHFDIITGTSTGGLIALGLGIGKSGDEIVKFYQNHGPKIFPNKGIQRFLRFFRGWFFNKYSNHYLEETLHKLFSIEGKTDEPILGESLKRLIIPTFYAASSQPRLLKTPHDKRYRSDWRLPMWAVAMATSAAPTYLPSFRFNGNTYLDGGLWANNPSLVGVIEALEMGAKIENIRVLNISTTSSNSDCLVFNSPFLPIKAPYGRLGKLPWATKILTIMMQANSYSTTYMYLRQMLSEGNLAVIDDQINLGHAALDDINYDEFYTRGKSAGEQAKNSINNYFEHNAAEYIPSKEAMENG
jgi:predicted patatin/cPLA2 family phospholipase